MAQSNQGQFTLHHPIVIPYCQVCDTQNRAACPRHAYTQNSAFHIQQDDTPAQIQAMKQSSLEYYESRRRAFYEEQPERIARTRVPAVPFQSARLLFRNQ